MNIMFELFPIFFIVIFVIVIAAFVYSIGSGVIQWNKNNNSPVLIVDADVVAKRMSVSHHHNNDRMSSSSTYYVTFQVMSGDRMELRVPDREYGMLVEGDKGKLTFQGTRYKSFERV